ncbi:hypothetical protein [Chitinasiproducens palmae]|uniref:Uncharacterized protein n=1 Tax=Chitinasiproducens palmae TaxID=1770053 RepID=A0A1H2PQW4_9BURK|nr:hypothetical protein [Chitinasiproducens palmae]SDV49245.1 hypothetical protein SAMN05216551_107180 [Chitinasiproducens palmae]
MTRINEKAQVELDAFCDWKAQSLSDSPDWCSWKAGIDYARAALAQQAAVPEPLIGAFRMLLAASNRLWAEAEEIESPDGLAQVALQQYWDAFIDARDKAQDALLSAAPEAPAAQGKEAIPLHVIREWAERRIRACGPAGVTDQVALLEDAVRWAESCYRASRGPRLAPVPIEQAAGALTDERLAELLPAVRVDEIWNAIEYADVAHLAVRDPSRWDGILRLRFARAVARAIEAAAAPAQLHQSAISARNDTLVSAAAPVRYFVYDREGDGYREFSTDAERRDAHDAAIEACADYGDEWGVDVDEIVSGIVTHVTTQTQLEHMPEPCARHPENDGENCDDCDAWNEWPDHSVESVCNYQQQALAASAAESAERSAESDGGQKVKP